MKLWVKTSQHKKDEEDTLFPLRDKSTEFRLKFRKLDTSIEESEENYSVADLFEDEEFKGTYSIFKITTISIAIGEMLALVTGAPIPKSIIELPSNIISGSVVGAILGVVANKIYQKLEASFTSEYLTKKANEIQEATTWIGALMFGAGFLTKIPSMIEAGRLLLIWNSLLFIMDWCIDVKKHLESKLNKLHKQPTNDINQDF
jgi:hypothetical protein